MMVWSVHGFLGLPSDFDQVKANCIKQKPDLTWKSVDYNHTRELSPSNSLEEWGVHFNQWTQGGNPDQSPQILIGYSQGGRLGLQALANNPSLWKAAVLISVNPGIRQGEKPLRKQADQDWSHRFLKESFDKTVREWNSQPVFRGSKTEPERKEKDFNRHHLADALVRWSVAEQKDMREFLSKTSVPILYVAGEEDPKYCQIGESLQQLNTIIQFEKIEKAGHRVLFDQPQVLADLIQQFLGKITVEGFVR